MLKVWTTLFLMLAIGPLVMAEEVPSEVATAMSSLRAQMEVERAREKELHLLQLEVDRLKLEVEKKKAVVELGKMDVPGGGAGSLAVSDGQPFISLRYVFMAPGRKEAILDVDGVERRVKEGEDVDGGVVVAISAEGVSLKAKDGEESFLSRPR